LTGWWGGVDEGLVMAGTLASKEARLGHDKACWHASPAFFSPGATDTRIRYPMALTRAVWERGVTVPPGVECQDEAERLWERG
jgi:hypothetical protein